MRRVKKSNSFVTIVQGNQNIWKDGKVNLQNHFMQIKGGKTNMFTKFDVKFDVFQIWRKKENCFHVTSAAMNQRGVSPQTLWTSIFRNFVLVYKQTMVLLGIHL